MDRKNSTLKDNGQKEILTYIQADRPLVYNFFDVTSPEQLLDKEPTSGKRKSAEKKEASE